MIKYLIFLVLVSGNLRSQNKNNFSLELEGNSFTGIGNNFIADGLSTFTGIRGGFSGVVYKNAGLSLEYQKSFTQVKDVSVFGNLHSPELTSLEILAFYRYKAANKFDVEGNIGVGTMKIKSKSIYRKEGFSEGGSAFIIGGKALYSITKNNSLYLVAAPKLYFLSTFVEINDTGSDQYYSNSTLFNFSLGLRIYF